MGIWSFADEVPQLVRYGMDFCWSEMRLTLGGAILVVWLRLRVSRDRLHRLLLRRVLVVNLVGDEVETVAVVVSEVVTRAQLYALGTEHIANKKMHELMSRST